MNKIGVYQDNPEDLSSNASVCEGFLQWGGGAMRDSMPKCLTIPSAFLKTRKMRKLGT